MTSKHGRASAPPSINQLIVIAHCLKGGTVSTCAQEFRLSPNKTYHYVKSTERRGWVRADPSIKSITVGLNGQRWTATWYQATTEGMKALASEQDRLNVLSFRANDAHNIVLAEAHDE